MKISRKRNKKIVTTGRVKVRTFVIVVIVLTLAVSFEMFMQIRNNRKKVDASSVLLVEQIAEQVRGSIDREATLADTYKDTCITKANSAAYIIESNDLYMHSVVKLKTVADVVDVDEINIFDANGVIIAGTNPEYYGLSMDSGDQIGYFKPMLEDKNLTMCQDPDYNTGAGKMMMYACVWNERKTRMYQVGISPARIIDKLEISSINSIVDDITYSTGVNVMIADAYTGDIIGSSIVDYDGMNLTDFNLYRNSLPEGDYARTHAVIDGEACYTIIYNEGDYLICASQGMFEANQDIAYSTLIMLLFLIVAILLLLYFINTAVDNVREQETLYLREVEKERANRLETTVNDIMKNALDQNKTSDGIKIVVREMAKELGAKSCMLYAEDVQMGLEPINIQWMVMPDGTDEFLQVEDPQIPRDSWSWTISTDNNAVIYDVRELENISPEAYGVCMRKGNDKVATISFINQYRAIGFMVLADPNIERMEDIALVMKQMSKFVISLLKIKAAFDKLTYLGYNDNLTHALNRRALDDRADRIEAGSVVALIFCDITGLKRTNDELGHDEGDKLIINAYNLLEEEFGANDVYRVGGDEFICLLEDITQSQLDEAVAVLEERLSESGIEMSVGSAWTGDFAGDFDHLERAADANMYTNKVEYYRMHPELKREIFERRHSQEMRAMIENLAQAYPLVGIVHLGEGTYRIIKGDEAVVATAQKYKNYDEFVKVVMESTFEAESARRLKSAALAAELKEVLTEKESLTYNYKLTSGGWRQMTYQVSEREDGVPTKAIFFANNLSDALAERALQGLTIENEDEILEGLSYDYSIIAIIDKPADKVKVYRFNNFPAQVAEAIDRMTFEQVVGWYEDNFVAEEDKAKFHKMTELEYVSSHLTDTNNFSFIFKTNEAFRDTKNGSYARFYFYKIDSKEDTYVFATRNVSFEMSLAYLED